MALIECRVAFFYFIGMKAHLHLYFLKDVHHNKCIRAWNLKDTQSLKSFNSKLHTFNKHILVASSKYLLTKACVEIPSLHRENRSLFI